jgi:hypothetical protein
MATRGTVFEAPVDGIPDWGTSYTDLSATEVYSPSVDANGYNGINFEIRCLGDSSKSDDIIIRVYAHLSDDFDDAADDNDVPIYEQRATVIAAEEIFVTITVRDVEFARIGIVQTAGTDTHTAATRSSRFRDTDN